MRHQFVHAAVFSCLPRMGLIFQNKSDFELFKKNRTCPLKLHFVVLEMVQTENTLPFSSRVFEKAPPFFKYTLSFLVKYYTIS